MKEDDGERPIQQEDDLASELAWIGELGLPCQRHDVGRRYGGTDTPAFLTLNPNGTVPVLSNDEGDPLWETGAILRYLAGRYASTPFWPGEGPARAPSTNGLSGLQLSFFTFLAAEDFTLADIQFGHVLFRCFDISITRKDRPALRRYYDTLVTRPAFREHVMVSCEELRVFG